MFRRHKQGSDDLLGADAVRQITGLRVFVKLRDKSPGDGVLERFRKLAQALDSLFKQFGHLITIPKS
jgi:hypothetical protein